MPTALLTHVHPSKTERELPPALPGTLPRAAAKRIRKSNLDSLLKETPIPQAAASAELAVEPDAAPGIFLALRVALLFNAGVGVAALLAYETWTMLAR